MITTENIKNKINEIKRLDDLVALNHYLDYLIFRESDEKTELGQSIINGLEDILNGKTYKIASSQEILKVLIFR